MRWNRIIDGIADALWPRWCAACRRAVGDLCSDCTASLTAMPALRRETCGAARLPVVALGDHRGRLRTAIISAKFGGARRALRLLGALLASRIPWRVDVVVPVPLHPARQRSRGYNQAAEIARGLTDSASLPLELAALLRPIETRAQSTLSGAEREANVRGAFAAGPAAERMRGTRVLLVDDVVTTGATVEACAMALEPYTPARIYVASLALRL